MIHAYDKKYLDDAMKNLGEMMDYVVYACHMDADAYLRLFIASGYAAQFEAGAPKIVSGLSGTELALEVFRKSGMEIETPAPQEDYTCSPAYWCGWILAYYQWYTRRSFKNICQNICFQDVEKLYPTLHEAAEDKFVDTVNRMIRRKRQPTRLQTLRKVGGYTQKQLSERSGVNLRTLQQYELRGKDINKAAGETLAALSSVLGCQVEDLLEYDAQELPEE